MIQGGYFDGGFAFKLLRQIAAKLTIAAYN